MTADLTLYHWLLIAAFVGVVFRLTKRATPWIPVAQ
jgi:hypothetical protein